MLFFIWKTTKNAPGNVAMLTVITCKSSHITRMNFADGYETVIVMPCITPDLALKVAGVLQERTERDALLVLAEDDARLGFIMTANMVFARTRSAYFGYLAEDVFPGYYWLEYALDPLRKTGAGLLAFSDGRFFGKLATFGLVKRAWVNTLYQGKCLFYPEYKAHFGDTELSVIAERTKNLIYNPSALMIEVDYEKHRKANNAADEQLYRRRESSGFGGLITCNASS